MAITRSTASAFPVNNEGTGILTSASVTLGNQGDLVLVWLSISEATVVVSTMTAPNLTFSLVEQFRQTNGTDIELWSATVGASAAGTTVTVTITTSIPVTSAFLNIDVDSLVSGLGTGTIWTAGTPVTINNASATTVNFPAVTAPSTGALLAYWGCLQCAGEGETGVNPVNGVAFTYSLADGDSIAFSSGIVNSAAYQPSTSLFATYPAAGIGVIFSATTSGGYILPPSSIGSQAVKRASSR